MRDWSPGPADMRKASSAEKATRPRKSRVAASGTFAAIQVRPALVVRRYVPWVPEAHTIDCETALTLRRFSVVGGDWVWREIWARAVVAKSMTKSVTWRNFTEQPQYARGRWSLRSDECIGPSLRSG